MMDEEIGARKKGHEEDTFLMWLLLNETSFEVIWNFLPGSKVNGISNCPSKRKKREIIHFTLLISQKLVPDFFVCEFMGPSLGLKRYR